MFAFAFLLLIDDPAVQDGDEWRFPVTKAQAQRGYTLGHQHYQWVVQSRPWDLAWQCDALWRYRCWDLIDDCRRIHPLDKAANRRKLTELKRLIGEEWYWRGILPDYLPTYRFTER